MQRKLYPVALILHSLSTGKVQYEDLRFIRSWMQIGPHVGRYPGVVVACKTWEEDHRHCYSSSREERSLERVNLICAGDRLPWGALQGCEVQPCSINIFNSITSFNIFCRLPRENHISTYLNELDICMPHRNLIKPSQAVKRGEDEKHITGISDISQYAAERLRLCSGGHRVTQKSETRGDPRISLLWRWYTHPYIFSQVWRKMEISARKSFCSNFLLWFSTFVASMQV